MNKIIFSPFFNQATYSRAEGEIACGDRVVGIAGLLSELELRAGMTHPEVSPFNRLIAYVPRARSRHRNIFEIIIPLSQVFKAR